MHNSYVDLDVATFSLDASHQAIFMHKVQKGPGIPELTCLGSDDGGHGDGGRRCLSQHPSSVNM